MIIVRGLRTSWTEEIEKQFREGNAKAIYNGVRALCGTKKRFTTRQPTMHNGKRIASPEELANVWKIFLTDKFSPTELELLREEYKALPDSDEADRLQYGEFEDAVKHIRNGKTRGTMVSLPKSTSTQRSQRNSSLNFYKRFGTKNMYLQSWQ